MAKKKFNNYNKGQETMGAKIEDTAVNTAVGTEEEMTPAGEEQVELTGSGTANESEKLDAVDSEFKVANTDDVKNEDVDATAKVCDGPLLSDEEISKLIDAGSDINATLEQTPPPVDTDAEIEQLKDSTYPPVAVIEPDEDLNPDDIDTTTLVFNKKTINELIANYMDTEITENETISVLNTVENQKARCLIDTLTKMNTAAGDKVETKILHYLALYLEPIDSPKNPGMLMQLIAKEINEAKTVADLDIALYILTRVFTKVGSFNIRSFLKIGNDYSSEFKVNALQMVEAFSQLSTAEDRKKKLGATISLQKTFKTSTAFLNANGAKLMIEYFSK